MARGQQRNTKGFNSSNPVGMCVCHREITTDQAARNWALACLPKGQKLGIGLTAPVGRQS